MRPMFQKIYEVTKGANKMKRKYSTPMELVEAGFTRANSEDPLENRNAIVYLALEDMFDQILVFVEEREFEKAITRIGQATQILEIELQFDPANVDPYDWVEKAKALFK